MAFHEQFYKIEPEMTINDLVKVKQYEHKSTEDFIMRFRRTRMRCQFSINHVQLIDYCPEGLEIAFKEEVL